MKTKYIVEDWHTEEIIEEFDSEEERNLWLSENSKDGFMADGTEISIYEQNE